MAKISELTEFEGPAICGIKLPHHCLAQEILLLHLQYAAAGLREDMISNIEFVNNTSGMLNILKAIIIWKQTKKNEQLELLIHVKKIKILLLKEILV